MIEIEQLWQEIDARVHPLPAESAVLNQVIGRVLHQPVCATADQPAFPQSAMDGFAFADATPGRCQITGTVAAGSGLPMQVRPGEAVRILTGGRVPSGTWAVARQEDCAVDGNVVEMNLSTSLPSGGFIRPQGGVFRLGEEIIPAGTRISAGALALLASAGIASVDVHRRATAMHVVTGDEIVPVGEPLQSGQTYDSNGPMVRALLIHAGVSLRTIALGDQPAELAEVVAACDDSMLLLSGGSGPGDHDHTTSALEKAGYIIHANRLNSRPGKPLIFATRGEQIAFGLPGNPLAHWVCFHAFVQRAMDRLHGISPQQLVPATLAEPIDDAGDGRRTWTPAELDESSGALMVWPLRWKHSGDLTPLRTANALILDGVRSDRQTVYVLPIMPR